ncbi:MAG: FAD-dependent oxidoreductase, partial [Paenibacillus sp.]|nr:FAD-dependent oxidoreductase [Paenibacillus sp.]
MEGNQYDLIVVGGSMAGCFAALAAAKNGASVLLIESRTYLGREITATLRPWISRSGIEHADQQLLSLLGIESRPNGDDTRPEIPLKIGTIKKNLLNELLDNRVGVVFMSGAAAALLAGDGRLGGVIIGNKSGLQAFTATAVIDATERQTVARLCGQTSEELPRKLLASRTIQLQHAALPGNASVDMPAAFGLHNHQVHMHQGVEGEDHLFAEFSFEVDANCSHVEEQTNREIEARMKTVRVCEHLIRHVPEFRQAVMISASPELWCRPVSAPLSTVHKPVYSNLFALDTDRLLDRGADFDSLMELKSASEEAANQALHCCRPSASPPEIGLMQAKMKEHQIPVSQLSPVAHQDGSLGIHYYSVRLTDTGMLPLLTQCSIAVAGGGTAGASAAIGAARHHPNVVLIEGNTDLGGTGTIGGINKYWFGYDAGFAAELDGMVSATTRRIGGRPAENVWSIEAKMMTYLEQLHRHNGTVLFRTFVVDAVAKERSIHSLVVMTPEGLGLIQAGIVVDATGDGDVAARAGVPYMLGDGKGNVQTFNLCDWRTKGLLFGVNLDLGVIDSTDVFDTTRGIIVGHGNAKGSDFSAFLSTRESRHMRGNYTLTVRDILSGATHPDTIAVGRTDFDQHGLQSSPFARLGYLPYHKDTKEARLPYRACLTDQFDNLLIAGRAFSAERDAFSFMRMQRDMQNMGYALGIAAAHALRENIAVGQIDIGKL